MRERDELRRHLMMAGPEPQRCPTCNGELSYCGPTSFEGSTLDCLTCQQREIIEQTRNLLFDAEQRLAAAEVTINQLKGALGYEVPADTPPSDYQCGICGSLQQRLAAAEAEIELLRAENKLLRAENKLLRAELATVKVNYETYVNDVRTAEQAEIASLRAQLAAVHGLLREASDGRVLDWVDWIERAKKEVGDG